MNGTLTWQLALRYLRGRRSANAVPILSRISMVAIGVGSAAMIIMFSVFNGLESVVKDSYRAFYPDVRILPKEGKFFNANALNMDALKHIPGVAHVAPVLEDDALVGNENEFSVSATQQRIVSVKGVTNEYFAVNEVGNYIEKGGADTLSQGESNTVIVGIELSHVLGAEPDNSFSYLMLYYLNPDVRNPEADPANAFQTLKLHPSGAFRVLGDFDDKYMLAPLPLIQQLFHAEGRLSAVELKTAPGKAEEVKRALQQQLGNTFKIQTRFEQNQTLYMVMSGEKWAMYAILLFVLIIASFNMMGALSMLVLQKRKDIAILKAMGATNRSIRSVFLMEGVLWACTGGVTGLLIGMGICGAQQKFNLIKMQGMVVNAYPVKFVVTDMLLVLFTIISVALVMSLLPAYRATRTVDVSLKSN